MPDEVSFNPCFAGCWSGSIIEKNNSNEFKLFQSLFCWMLVWKLLVRLERAQVCSVSILVLLDVGLEERVDINDGGNNSSFNPCFAGCWSGRFRRRRATPHPDIVSILVLLDVGLEASESYDV